MSDTSKRIARVAGVGIIWVFVLSVHVRGRTLFYYANDILVQNRVVAAVDQTLADAFDSVMLKVSSTYNSITGDEKRL